jgi:hypothetical protein
VATPMQRGGLLGRDLLLGGRDGSGTILTMAASVVVGILALRLAATSRMAPRGTRCRGSAAEPQFFSWQIQRRPQTRPRKTQEFYRSPTPT